MGLVCSTKRKEALQPLSPRLSPWSRFGRRSFNRHRRMASTIAPDSLLATSLDALAKSLPRQYPAQLRRLPMDLAQLLLDRLIEAGKLNDAAVLRLQGLHFYELVLDAYPEVIKDFWVRFLITETLEVAVLSRTQVDDFMLSAVPYLPNLRVLSLEYCDGITDAGMAVLHRLPALEELNLSGCDALGPLGVGCIGRASSLRRLKMDACHKVWSLGPLRQLASLEALDLGWCISVGDEDAAAVASLPALHQLRLCHTAMTDAGVSKLTALERLTSLSLGGLRLSDNAVAALLASLPCLEELDLERCSRVGNNALRALAATNPPLRALDLSYTAVGDAGLTAVLPKVRLLRKLDLESCSGVGELSLAQLSLLTALEHCDLTDTRVTNACMAGLARLPYLDTLLLAFTEVEGWGLESLSKSRSLRCLNLDSRTVDDGGVAHIARLPRLEQLDLFGATVTDAACASLAKVSSLRWLEICAAIPSITDAGVAKLAQLTGLHHLSLSQNGRITNACIPDLMRLTGLQALNLSQSRVTGSAVVTLGCLPRLESLALAGTRVRAPTVRQLQRMKPDLEVKGVPMTV